MLQSTRQQLANPSPVLDSSSIAPLLTDTTPARMASLPTMSAIRRLQHDLREIQAAPVPNVWATPSDGDLMRFSVTMVAPSTVQFPCS